MEPATHTPPPLGHQTDAELLYITHYARRYPPALVQAAVQELQRRELIPRELPGATVPQTPPPPGESSGWAEVRHAARSLFWPAGTFFVTPLLLQLNVLVYLLMVLTGVDPLAPASADLVAWGSNFSPLTLHGQPWRLLTSCFVHGGVAHLLLNAGSLLFLGSMTEPLLGRGRLLLGYLLSGLGASLTSLWWHTQGVNAVGASGAIFGLYGLQLALALTKATPHTRHERRTLLGFVLYLALSSLVAGLEGPATIDNAAHVGGLLTGFVVGLLLGQRRRRHAVLVEEYQP